MHIKYHFSVELIQGILSKTERIEKNKEKNSIENCMHLNEFRSEKGFDMLLFFREHM